MRRKWRRINAILLAFLILTDGFSGFFTENRVLANEGYPGSDLVESLEVNTTEINSGDTFNVVAKLSGQTENPEGERYINSEKEILIPLEKDKNAEAELNLDQSQIEKVDVTLENDGIKIKFLEGVEEEPQVVAKLNLTFKGVNTDAEAVHKIVIANEHEINIQPNKDEEVKSQETKENEEGFAGFRNATPTNVETVTNTFESDGGEYTLDYILNNYNVFVSGDYIGQHVVGSVVTGGMFKGSLSGLSTGGEYFHKSPSYIRGNFESGNTIYTNTDVYMGTVNNNGNKIYLVNDKNEQREDAVLYTDSYIDFNQWDQLTEQAKNIAKNSSVTVSYNEAGELVSSNPDEVSIQGKTLNVQAGNTVFMEFGNMEGMTINVIPSVNTNTVITSNEQGINLPLTQIDGKDPENIENHNEGISLVYSFPNAKSVIAEREITGHIVAPQAKIELSGGEYNGCLIAKNVSSLDEGHMWPYSGPGLVKTNIPVKKVWDDNDNEEGKRPGVVQVQLLKDGKEVPGEILPLLEKNNWSGVFQNLEPDANYTVKEIYVTDGYKSYITGDAGSGYIITNSNKIEIPVRKVWNDNGNEEGKRPGVVQVQLLKDGKEVPREILTLLEKNNWSGSFKKLEPQANYEVRELYTAKGYKSRVTGDDQNGYIITNSSIVNVPVKKVWDNNDNEDGKRPGVVQVQLLKNGEEVNDGILTLLEKNNWSGSFKDLDEYENGKKIEYTVKEKAVKADYISSISGNAKEGYVITNTRNTKKINIKGTKTWKDNNNQDGKRPKSIIVNLLANGKQIKSKRVTDKKDWSWEFKDLPKYEAGEGITYTVTENKVEDYSTTIKGYDITNVHTPGKTSVQVTKAWEDKENQDGVRPQSVEIQLLANEKETGKTLTLLEANNWTDSFTDLDEYQAGEKIKYTVKETVLENGYYSEVIGDASTGYTITNTREPEKTSVEGSKTWDDYDNQDGKRPESITITLLGNGEEIASKTVTEKDNWSWKFENLDKFKDGKEVAYTVKESEVPGYTSEVDGYNVINNHAIEQVKVEGTKTWNDNDNQDGKRPESIRINLLANGKEIASKEVTAADNWNWQFEGLDKYEAGKEIVYSIVENQVEGYSTIINGYDITNSYTPGKTSVQVTKAWEDHNNQDGKRPGLVEVQLLKNGEEVPGKILTLLGKNNWSGSFIDLDEYEAGEKIEYTVKEIGVNKSYTSMVNGSQEAGYIITNTLDQEKTEIIGNKIWQDEDNQDGKRPEAITVNLLANGKWITSKEVTAEDDWSWKFENLNKFAAGEEIIYSIVEDRVEDYSTTITGNNIINSYTPGKTSIQVTKAWEDNHNQDGKRAGIVQVQLMKNGEEVENQILTLLEKNNWTGSFTNLDEYEAGEKINYTVKEIGVKNGYTSKVSGNMETGYLITNTKNPETTEVVGYKTWDDENNQDGKRPESLKINLLANGRQIASKVVTAADNWSWKFENLDKFAAGEEIIYSVVEDRVEDYSTTITGNDIINAYTPGKTSIQVTKAWEDNHNQDGKRAGIVQVQLMKNGEEVENQILTLLEKNNWTGSFTDLDEYQDGKKIDYTVKEIAVENGYTSFVTGDANQGYIITNTKKPEKTVVEGTKTWDDNDNQDGKRPESITINLLANGKWITSKKVTAEDGWS